MIAVIDVAAGDVQPTLAALELLDVSARIAARPEDLIGADGVLLPAHHAFGEAMSALRDAQLVEPLLAHVSAGRPLLATGAGMHLLGQMCTDGGAYQGLGLVPGTVLRLPAVPPSAWHHVDTMRPDGPVSAAGGDFWFAGAAHLVAGDEHVQARTTLGQVTVAAAVANGPVWGVRFPPERSGPDGLDVLARFVARSRGLPT
ncbi:MAG: hypothetical protein U0Y82_07185 [Thermoleophilia bacterium]